MRSVFPLLAVIGLAACAGPLPPSNPDRVTLLSDTLAVHFNDGSVCRANIKAAPSGRLPDCAQAMDYTVVVKHPIWVKGAETFMEPYADITLTRPSDGRHWTVETPQTGSGETERRPSLLTMP